MYPESQLASELHEITKKTISELDAIWDDVGLDDETRKVRKQLFSKHVQDLYSDMIKESEISKKALEKKIDALLSETSRLANDLRLDISLPNENVPLNSAIKKLESNIEKYRKIYSDRVAEIKKLDKKQKLLCTALGKECIKLTTSPLPTEDELHDIRTYLEELSDLKFQNEEIFLKKKSAIIDIMNELKIVPTLDFERKVVLSDDSDFQVSEENMVMLEQLYLSLTNQLEETRTKIAELREVVSNLWELLEESPEVRSQFSTAHPGNSVDTLRALKEEIARCQEKKKENIKLFVNKMRQELVGWWDLCKLSPEQRSEFLHFESDCFTEDLLSLHELQIEKVKSHYEKHKHIYDLVSKREELWQKMIDLEQRANQPERYKNRGGQLLREEKERKLLAAKLPKIEQELLELVAEYELETGTAFLINGNSLSNIIDSAWEEHKENKHVTLSARKYARENSKLTPCKSRLGTPRLQTPLTPVLMSASKCKFATPHSTNVKRSRIYDEKILRTAPSKLQVMASSIRRVSLERKKRIEKIKRRSIKQLKNCSISSVTSDYNGFAEGLQSKPTCRSSLFPHKAGAAKILQPPAINVLPATPRKALQVLTNTPQRTPSRLNMRAKSPTPSASKLQPAPGALPIII